MTCMLNQAICATCQSILSLGYDVQQKCKSHRRVAGLECKITESDENNLLFL